MPGWTAADAGIMIDDSGQLFVLEFIQWKMMHWCGFFFVIHNWIKRGFFPSVHNGLSALVQYCTITVSEHRPQNCSFWLLLLFAWLLFLACPFASLDSPTFVFCGLPSVLYFFFLTVRMVQHMQTMWLFAEVDCFTCGTSQVPAKPGQSTWNSAVCTGLISQALFVGTGANHTRLAWGFVWGHVRLSKLANLTHAKVDGGGFFGGGWWWWWSRPWLSASLFLCSKFFEMNGWWICGIAMTV